MSYLLNPRGVSEQLKALYALSNSALEAEAISIKSDFKSWVEDHFDLTTPQKNHLYGMSPIARQFFGDQCWICFLFRLPITLVYPSPPAPTGYGKWVESSTTPKLIANGNGDVEASGQLTIEMVYRPLGD
jgi:hypothetical protein